ncbi:uncharacterized protein LOC119561993 isoform X1 [Drosophila subpulchrella]|uniref:uncharacterized protein LOC119561993 isoform X1 n=1 Tax=Drosophila subpulchrella TaxID=1486046 RepID=UPI0018A15E09|nr:uncharacterized protein LOC119561993 isoform X1 [Drosophila subpulchrella]
MASSEAKGKNPYSELSNVKSPKLSPLKKKKPMDKNLVESECKEVEMKEVNDPVTHPSPSSQSFTTFQAIPIFGKTISQIQRLKMLGLTALSYPSDGPLKTLSIICSHK